MYDIWTQPKPKPVNYRKAYKQLKAKQKYTKLKREMRKEELDKWTKTGKTTAKYTIAGAKKTGKIFKKAYGLINRKVIEDQSIYKK